MTKAGASTTITPPARRILDRLRAIYPDPSTADATSTQLHALIEKWRPHISPARHGWSESDALLITYADSILDSPRAPLDVLHQFLQDHVSHRFSFLHLLPFFPSTSDRGFSVSDYRAVRPDLGSWKHIPPLASNYRLVFDAVLNHVSSQSEYVRGHLDGDPAFAGFCIEKSSAMDTSNVVRPRQSPLFHSFPRNNGDPVELWTTFSRDQVDLDFRNPAVLLEIVDVLLTYAAHGASMIRLDAIPYLWKESATSCIHLPTTHQIIRLIRAVFDAVAPHVILLSETNVPHAENVSYFGGAERDEAQIIYNFSLPPLLLHTLATGNASRLTQWAQTLEDFGDTCTFLNITATHDGIGMRPTEGILDENERNALLDLTTSHGGNVNYKSNSDGSSTPYELNINYFDAINNPNTPTPPETETARFLAAQSIPMILRGIPGIYIHSLLGSRNDPSQVVDGKSDTYRNINRAQLNDPDLRRDLENPASLRARVFHGLANLLDTRRTLPALHPAASQRVLDLGPQLFAVLRDPGNAALPLVALVNVSADTLEIPAASLPITPPLIDHLTGDTFDTAIPLTPYAVRWLTPHP